MKHLINIAVSIIILALLSNCQDYTEIDLPKNQLTRPIVFEDQQTATSALNFIYSQIREYSLMGGNSLSATQICSIYADDLTYNSSSVNDYSNLFNYNITANTNIFYSIWSRNYSILYSINSFIEGIEKSSKLEDNYKNQVYAEALTLRAFLHFNLTNLFGDIPYITTTDYTLNNKVSRTNQEQVYRLLTQDLLQAEQLLFETYPTQLKTRINKSSAQALLARVYLFQQNWTEAISWATKIINANSLYQLETIDKLFLKESTSTIWQLQSGNTGNNTLEAMSFILEIPPVTYLISENLINSFSSSDQRLKLWTKDIGNFKIPYKYKAKGNTTTSKEYTIVLRLEELYLIRAEAYAKSNQTLNLALQDLNTVHLKSDTQKITLTNQTDIQEAIFKEKQLEFFSEQGHRWFDLIRTNQVDAILSKNKHNWKTNNKLFPIPLKEISINPNLLPQNEGY